MKLWEKNFEINKEIERFTVGRDRELDLYLAKYDVMGSMAHITMLESIGLLTPDELRMLLAALKDIYVQAERGEFTIEEGIEDVHSQVELMLTRRLGDVGKKIHSGRSRNDQVLLDLKLFTRDRLFRCVEPKALGELMKLFQELDVCAVVGRVARENDFCFPVANAEGEVSMKMEGLHHPCIPGAISNDMAITKEKNIFFLTGANMAGKSTLMKSFGIAVYMAHMGFPVAAKRMEFTVQDGIYTSINVPDNINMGYSHFYAEVLRVKKVAIEVSRSKKLVVIFDELFKGTNVKDAFDATLAVASALAKRRACSFLISTHIIEVGQELGKACDNVTFAYLPTVMDGKIPRYTYRLQPGITADKHGMIIINNEKIIETIRGEV